MATVTLSPLFHRNTSQIAIHFDHDEHLSAYIKDFEGTRWSHTHNIFYLANTPDNKQRLFNFLRLQHHYVDYSALGPGRQRSFSKTPTKKYSNLGELSKKHHDAFLNFKNYLLQRRYSQNTIENYISVLAIFFRFHASKDIFDINKNDIITFNQDYILSNGYSRTFQNQIISAIKLFYNNHNNTKLDIANIERPIKEKRLPEILSKDEVKHILTQIKNVKHKTILILVYACGLRIGEALSLKINDIDGTRGFIHIKHAKGAKDRYVPLSSKTLIILRNYYGLYKPKTYLFEGLDGHMYSQGSCRKILRNALQKTTIKKHVTLHTFRHSYATHLLESGTDLRYIQDILGHNSPKTTMIYTHVSQSSLKNIKNPFDDMDI